jgi:hypothetical protein
LKKTSNIIITQSLTSHSNVLGLRRVPLGQRPNLAFDFVIVLGFDLVITDGCLFCLGTHSFVILCLTIPLGHLFNLIDIILFLLLPESTFDFTFDRDGDNVLDCL